MKTQDSKSPVQGFKRPRKDKVGSNVADWASANAEIFLGLVAIASQKGAAIRFGYTRDGGAYSIGLYVGGDYFTDYLRPEEDLDEYIRELTESFREFDPAVSDPPGKRKTPR